MSRPAFGLRFAAMLAGVLLLAASALLSWRLVGEAAPCAALLESRGQKPLRFLIDDSKVEWWGPSHGEWRDQFGDFYAYGFQSLRDWIRRRWGDCEVGLGGITPERLRGVDVLVVKVPEAQYTAEETEVVRRWVAHGGRLMALGDHTNLLGSSVALNNLIQFSGMEFRLDHVCRVDHGGVVDAVCVYADRTVLRGTVMSACSVGGAGVPIVTVDSSMVTAWDPTGSSGFSTDESMVRARGVTSTIGMARVYGDGVVCAFGDTTLFSGFALHKARRTELFSYLVACMDPDLLTKLEFGASCRANSGWIGMGWLFGMFVMGLGLGRSSLIRWSKALGVLIACIWGSGVVLSMATVAIPAAEIVPVWRVRGIGRAVFIPESIGGNQMSPEQCYDGAVYALVRGGRGVQSRDDGWGAGDAIWCIASSGAHADHLDDWLSRGMHLCVWADGWSVLTKLASELNSRGWSIEKLQSWNCLGAADESVVLFRCRREGAVFCLGGCYLGLSDASMPHPMSVPTPREQSLVESIANASARAWQCLHDDL